MRKFDVIVPCGGTIDDEFARVVNTRTKALVKFEDVTILTTTIAALRKSPHVDRIVVIGPESVGDTDAAKKADEFLIEGKTGPENIFRGLDWLLKTPNPPTEVMIVTGDLPFLTAESINKFVALCPQGKDICIPLISKEEFQDLYPRAEATFVGLRDGTWTTGCAYLATASGLQTAVHHINLVFKNRKSKLGMARLLGLGFVFKYLTKSLSVQDVEGKAKHLLGIEGVAVRGVPPELAYDIDDLDDYHYALSNLGAHRRETA
ncbi:MAG TPA: NTP transferase domain-containing protein [Fimbriimonadaceae bacterium]|nr:NTP transferase domain-containing protein [Fimbriimonadaceae bacterium]